MVYYIPINDTSFELSVFWLSGTENRINELRFSVSVSLAFKTRFPVFAVMLRKMIFKHGTRDEKHNEVTSGNVTLLQTFLQFYVSKDQNRL